ncbi:histidine-containing phosphotransfer protein 2 [Senna tora]|uniref:Histidine-containing phosphotransfer protein n=1 Tax=Senna tora TaxID=362788 RepID=A0A834TDG7_9FABA|nr:histidine-containing phosphotransfer protein 2 [Senna tora]
MERQHLHQQIATMKESLFDEGLLCRDQFQQLEDLQDEKSPHFVMEIFAVFLKDTIRQFNDLDKDLFQEEGQHKENTYRLIYLLKGSVVSIGALKMLDEINKMRQFWEEDNLEGTKAAYEKVKQERENLKLKVEPYFQLLRQVGPSESA